VQTPRDRDVCASNAEPQNKNVQVKNKKAQNGKAKSPGTPRPKKKKMRDGKGAGALLPRFLAGGEVLRSRARSFHKNLAPRQKLWRQPTPCVGLPRL